MGAQVLGMLEQFAAMGGEKGSDPVAEMFSAEKSKAKAGKMGEGGAFEKTEPISANGGKGARVIYRFADINKLKVSPVDGMNAMSER